MRSSSHVALKTFFAIQAESLRSASVKLRGGILLFYNQLSIPAFSFMYVLAAPTRQVAIKCLYFWLALCCPQDSWVFISLLFDCKFLSGAINSRLSINHFIFCPIFNIFKAFCDHLENFYRLKFAN